MTRSLSMLIACFALLLLLTGCGSSSKSSAGTSAASSGASATSPGASGERGGLKLTTAPRYATPSPSAPVRSGTVQVAYRDITIQPDTLRVKVGSTVRWTNYDPIEHNVTSEGGPLSFKSSNFGQGKSFEVKVTRAGVIHYECTIHPASMNGTIEAVG